MPYQENFLVRFILSFHKYKTQTVNEKLLKENSNSVILNPLTYFARPTFSEGLEHNLQ